MGVTYLGISYIIVYIGAIAILFLFVIMMIDVEVVEKRNNNYLPLLFLLLGGFIFTLKKILYSLGVLKLKSFSFVKENNFLTESERKDIFGISNSPLEWNLHEEKNKILYSGKENKSSSLENITINSNKNENLHSYFSNSSINEKTDLFNNEFPCPVPNFSVSTPTPKDNALTLVDYLQEKASYIYTLYDYIYMKIKINPSTPENDLNFISTHKRTIYSQFDEISEVYGSWADQKWLHINFCSRFQDDIIKAIDQKGPIWEVDTYNKEDNIDFLKNIEKIKDIVEIEKEKTGYTLKELKLPDYETLSNSNFEIYQELNPYLRLFNSQDLFSLFRYVTENIDNLKEELNTVMYLFNDIDYIHRYNKEKLSYIIDKLSRAFTDSICPEKNISNKVEDIEISKIFDFDLKQSDAWLSLYNNDYQDNHYLLVIPNWNSAISRVTQISSIGDVLYTVYHSYIYIVSIILLLGMVGAIILTTESSQGTKIINIEKIKNSSILSVVYLLKNLVFYIYSIFLFWYQRQNKNKFNFVFTNSHYPFVFKRVLLKSLTLIKINQFKYKNKLTLLSISPFFGVITSNNQYSERIIDNLNYYIIANIIIGLLLLFINSYFSLSVRYLEKGGGFECGFTSFVQTRERFNVIFYRVSLLFLVFDLEIILAFPYPAIYQKNQNISKNNVLIFLYILVVGFIFELKEGALNIVKKAHET